MVKCATCGTAWTSSGLPLCPVCGTRVEEPVASSKSPKEDRRPAPVPLINYVSTDSSGRKASNGKAVLEISPEFRNSESRVPGQLRVVDLAPVQAPVLEPKLETYIFPQLKRVEPSPAIASLPAPVPTVNEARPMPLAPPETRKPETRVLRITEAIDASAILPVQAGAKILPGPARPMNGPLILGFLAFVPALMLPLTVAFEGSRVLGILGFCMSGFFAPFAPIAWIAGLSAEKRRRDQGLRSERRVSIGRLLGQGATLILVAELTLALVGIAALRLSGKFPNSFWSYL
jgi:hypothetical protein